MAGRYRPVRMLSQDAYGASYLAVDLELDASKVVLRTLSKSVLSGKRCLASVKTAAVKSLKLLHTNIASVRALEDNNGNPFLVEDYVEGQTLDSCLDDWGKLSEEETRSLLEPIASALDYAHEKEVVHRDVRPSNIIVDESASSSIRGFCVACEIREAVARIAGGNAAGPVSYMSPEQLTGAAPNPRQDIYSFAAIAYECLVGHPPFFRGQIEYQVVNVAPEPLPTDTPFTRAIMRALSKDPAKRPETCADILTGDIPQIVIPPEPVHDSSHAKSTPRPSNTATQKRPGSAGHAANNARHENKGKETHQSKEVPQAAQPANPSLIEKALARITASTLMQVAVSCALIIVLVACAFGISSCNRKAERKRIAALTAPRGDKHGSFAMSSKYAEFFGIAFGTPYAKLPSIGDDVGFGIVTAVAAGNNGFDVQLSKPLFKVFSKVHIRLVGGDANGNDGRIAEVKYTKEGEGIEPSQAKKVVAKIAQLIGDGYGIDMGDPKASVNDSYFSQKYRDEIIDIRISCAVSQDSTSFFISVENMQVMQ